MRLERLLAALLTGLIAPFALRALSLSLQGRWTGSPSALQWLRDEPLLYASSAGLCSALLLLRSTGNGWLVPPALWLPLSPEHAVWLRFRHRVWALWAGLVAAALAYAATRQGLAALLPLLRGTRFEGLLAPLAWIGVVLPLLVGLWAAWTSPKALAAARLRGWVDGYAASDWQEACAVVAVAAVGLWLLTALFATIGAEGRSAVYMAISFVQLEPPDTTSRAAIAFDPWTLRVGALLLLLLPLLYGGLRLSIAWQRKRPAATATWLVWTETRDGFFAPRFPQPWWRRLFGARELWFGPVPQLPALRQVMLHRLRAGPDAGPTTLLCAPFAQGITEHHRLLKSLGREDDLFPTLAVQLADWQRLLPPPADWAALPLRECHPTPALMRATFDEAAADGDRLVLITADAQEVLAWSDAARHRPRELVWCGEGKPPPSVFDAASGDGLGARLVRSAERAAAAAGRSEALNPADPDERRQAIERLARALQRVARARGEPAPAGTEAVSALAAATTVAAGAPPLRLACVSLDEAEQHDVQRRLLNELDGLVAALGLPAHGLAIERWDGNHDIDGLLLRGLGEEGSLSEKTRPRWPELLLASDTDPGLPALPTFAGGWYSVRLSELRDQPRVSVVTAEVLRAYLAAVLGLPPQQRFERDVLIDARPPDHDYARLLVDALRSAGWRVAASAELAQAGGNAVEQAVFRSRLYLPVLSAAALDAATTLPPSWQASQAREDRISGEESFVLPVVRDDTLGYEQRVPERWRERGFLFAPEKRMEVLLGRVSALLARPAPPAAAKGVARRDPPVSSPPP